MSFHEVGRGSALSMCVATCLYVFFIIILFDHSALLWFSTFSQPQSPTSPPLHHAQKINAMLPPKKHTHTHTISKAYCWKYSTLRVDCFCSLRFERVCEWREEGKHFIYCPFRFTARSTTLTKALPNWNRNEPQSSDWNQEVGRGCGEGR